MAAAFPILRLCSGVVRPLDVGVCSSAYAVSFVAEAEDDALFLPGIMSFARRPCEAGRRRPPLGEVGREEGEDSVECGEVAEMVGIESDILQSTSSAAQSRRWRDRICCYTLSEMYLSEQEGCIVPRDLPGGGKLFRVTR